VIPSRRSLAKRPGLLAAPIAMMKEAADPRPDPGLKGPDRARSG
jgi:hypothetical protein